MIQANGFLLRLPVAKHLPYGAKHLVMRQTKMVPSRILRTFPTAS